MVTLYYHYATILTRIGLYFLNFNQYNVKEPVVFNKKHFEVFPDFAIRCIVPASSENSVRKEYTSSCICCAFYSACYRRLSQCTCWFTGYLERKHICCPSCSVNDFLMLVLSNTSSSSKCRAKVLRNF